MYFLVWCGAVWGDRFIITPSEFFKEKGTFYSALVIVSGVGIYRSRIKCLLFVPKTQTPRARERTRVHGSWKIRIHGDISIGPRFESPYSQYVRGVFANGSMGVGRKVNPTNCRRLECLFGFVIKADVVGTPFAIQRSGCHCFKLVEWTERYFAARTADFVMVELFCVGGTCTRSGMSFWCI